MRRQRSLVSSFFATFSPEHIYNFLLIPYSFAVGGETQIKLIYTALHGIFRHQSARGFFGAIALSFPVLAAQLYMFVAPGLYRNERKAFLPFLIAAPILFLLGGAIVFFIVMPLAVRFFLSMQQTGDVNIQLMPNVSEYLHLIMTLILAFGLCFQLPVLLTLLARAGMVTSQWLRAAVAVRHRAHFCGCRVSCSAGRPEPGRPRHSDAASLRTLDSRGEAGRAAARRGGEAPCGR